ncbi:hypothetical protein A2814_02430 [Candidatus Nomurabacteria bacterium RIFCSPHIGHO2_01_FULL_38_19]|uniref:Integrase catalytic domain-containing protein n=1 Tax=Candidatus Nomurabacteria bacterium RIFCSPHIGHO2_01_FULL_38_19 TaxID=1801732 RepID=A0A1F6UR99_9BACT|nr:MAG: hypothetical protein A2814_02430 [Candidatus Nomurabacteria bacterium RIFCSPHIGHO2_01_FULL_38_19]
MRQFNKFKDTKGFITTWQRVLRFRYMITEQAKERCRILAFEDCETILKESLAQAESLKLKETRYCVNQKILKLCIRVIVLLLTPEKQRNGNRMYILVALDLYSRVGFALGPKSHGSQTMAHFLYLISMLFPYDIKNVLSDNGSEFKKYFTRETGKKSIIHFHT